MKTTLRVDKDILKNRKYYNFRKNNSAKTLIGEALQYLTLENACFDFNHEKDEMIKQAIKLHHETWIIPLLEEAYNKLK